MLMSRDSSPADAWIAVGLAFTRQELCLSYDELDMNGTMPNDTLTRSWKDNYVACCNPSIYGSTYATGRRGCYDVRWSPMLSVAVLSGGSPSPWAPPTTPALWLIRQATCSRPRSGKFSLPSSCSAARRGATPGCLGLR